jgi:hypothetical protein
VPLEPPGGATFLSDGARVTTVASSDALVVGGFRVSVVEVH